MSCGTTCCSFNSTATCCARCWAQMLQRLDPLLPTGIGTGRRRNIGAGNTPICKILQDLTRQHGPPHVVLTIAPWEFDFPWPYWLQRLMATTNLGPTQLPAAEAIAVAHAVREFCTSYLSGFGRHRQWSQNLFSHKHKKCNNVLAFVGRWEFQEGGPSHSYGKGRGSLHCHLLFWLKDFRASLLERFICGALPTDDAELAALALQRQRSIPGTGSRAPVQEEASFWQWLPDVKHWALRLQHTASFVSAGLRPFVTSILRILCFFILTSNGGTDAAPCSDTV